MVNNCYPKIYAALKDSENAKLLHSQAAQQVMKSANEAFRGFKALFKLWRAGQLEEQPKLPRYRTKGGLYQVVFTGQSLTVKDSLIRIPLGKGYAAQTGQDCFYIPRPERLKDVQLRELRLIPTNGKWVVEFVHESMEQPARFCPLYPERVLALDPGLNNLLAGVTNTGLAFVMDGRRLKAENQGWNRLVSRLKSALTKGKESTKGMTSKRIRALTHNRNCFMRDALNKAARWVIDFCEQHHIDTITYGRNKRQKDGIKLGGKNNQAFVQIPHYKLFERIEQLCLIYGIRLLETEESYTSQASFFDLDFLPTHGEKPESWKPSGKRVKRGLYQTQDRHLLNADCQGAGNIMRKVSTKLGIDLSGVSRGAVAAPFKVKLTPAGFSLT